MQLIQQHKLNPYLRLLKWLLILAGIGLTCLLLIKDLYFYSWEEKKETIVYSIPMVFIFFLWLRYRLGEDRIFEHQLVLIDAVVVGLAAIRILGWLFHSGHVLFLLYTLRTTENKVYKWVLGLMLVFTLMLKFFYWGDFITPTIGAGMAIFFIWLRSVCENKLIEKTIEA